MIPAHSAGRVSTAVSTSSPGALRLRWPGAFSVTIPTPFSFRPSIHSRRDASSPPSYTKLASLPHPLAGTTTPVGNAPRNTSADPLSPISGMSEMFLKTPSASSQPPSIVEMSFRVGPSTPASALTANLTQRRPYSRKDRYAVRPRIPPSLPGLNRPSPPRSRQRPPSLASGTLALQALGPGMGKDGGHSQLGHITLTSPGCRPDATLAHNIASSSRPPGTLLLANDFRFLSSQSRSFWAPLSINVSESPSTGQPA